MVVYATREDVKRALDSKETARTDAQVDRQLASASRGVDGLCHRMFWPEIGTRRFDWPGESPGRPWRLWLDANDLISVTTLTSGGTVLASGDFFLRRSDNREQPPYTHIEINIGSNASFNSGDTYQRAIAITGLWGYTDAETALGTLTAPVDAAQTTVTVDGPTAAEVGVGSLLRLDAERVTVTGRTMTTTGQTLTASVTGEMKGTVLTVADASGFAADEVLLVDGERMLVVDTTPTTVVVRRAWDGSTIAAHTVGAVLYASRRLTVERAALGTTAGTYASGAAVMRWDPPGLVRDLTIGEALSRLTNERAGYARTRKTGDGGGGDRAVQGADLLSLREQVYVAHARKGRARAV
ncbi:hypothetical protein [Streptomyces jumonjinensis]|uniref:hypothetical protein n=1 Tax=Streptomyces jumonjinensis TaxID=1945 RepID=UPI00379D595C